MIRTFLTCAVLCFATLSQAQSLPALYDVVSVMSDDVLNVRSAPSAETNIVGTLASTAKNIEIVEFSPDQTWARINIGESTGWASLDFLSRQPDQNLGKFPAITSCYGTEPFWDLAFQENRLILSILGDSPKEIGAMSPARSLNRIDRFSFVAPNVIGFISHQHCSDGMSDRQFGLSIEALLANDGEPTHLSGCCSIQP